MIRPNNEGVLKPKFAKSFGIKLPNERQAHQISPSVFTSAPGGRGW